MSMELRSLTGVAGGMAVLLAGCSSSNVSYRADLNAGRADQHPVYARDRSRDLRAGARITYYPQSGPSYSAPVRAAPRNSYALSAAPAPFAGHSRARPATRRNQAVDMPHPKPLLFPALRTHRRDLAPLRRFAAMPRHKPHAPHVRQNESACLGSGIVRPTRFLRPSRSVGGGKCHVAQPFMMRAAASGSIVFNPPAKLRCQMVPSVERWVSEVLRPAARRYLGSEIIGLKIAASYACRTRNHKRGARLSEHGRANAIDISKFHLADGRVVTVKRGWRGAQGERRFLRYIHRGACEHFSTVLGPNADRYHHDHFHFDLAHHGRRGTYRVCR